MAVELIELGRPVLGGGDGTPQRPWLSGRPQLGILGDIVGFLGDVLTTAVGVIADIVSVPLDLLAQGVDFVFTNIASVISEIPIVGELVAEVLLVGNAVIKFALSLPGMLLHELENILGGLTKSFKESLTGDEQKDTLKSAKEAIVGNAPKDIKDDVEKVLDDTEPGKAAAPDSKSDFEEALVWGIPAAVGGAALIALIA